jgi:hypothetical protein
MNEELDLIKRNFRVYLDGHNVNFSIYGEEEDLETLDMFLTFLIKHAKDKADE